MDGVTEPFPLTDLQQAYLVGSTPLVELGNLRPAYYVELDVAGLDLCRARQAITLLIKHHDHLRTEVLPDGTQRVLPVDRAELFGVEIADLTALSRTEQEAAISRTRDRMSHEVAVTGWPLCEVAISRIRPHRVRVHLAMSLLLLDGKSIRQVWRDWQTLYRDQDALLPVTMLTFRDCVLSQLGSPAARRAGEHWRYWEARLDALPEAPRLPLATSPGRIERVRFVRRRHHLTAAAWQRLSAHVRQHRVTPATAMLHLFAEVLGRWSASPRFCLNVLHQGWSAHHPEAAGVVGQLGATLPLEITGEGTFWERARRTQGQLWLDYEHGEVSGVAIVREAAARAGRPPRAALPYVFTSMLGPRDAAEPPPAAATACRVVHTSLRTPQVLIDNQVADADDGGVDCIWDVVDDAFPAGLPQLMFGAYAELVDAIASPAVPAAMPDPVPAAHRARIAELNPPACTRPGGRLEDGFLSQAQLRPEAVAVFAPGQSLTYAGLAAASGAIACWLRDRGVGREDVVPVVMAKGWEQVAAVLGVLRAGAAYCPVDVNLPADRMNELLRGLRVKAVLGQSHAPAPSMAVPPASVLAVDRWRTEAPDPAPGPDAGTAAGSAADLAYVIYTSGSTGTPKGVMIEHGAALNTVLAVNERVGLGPGDRVLGLSSLSFDLSVWDIFGTLAAGATLVLPAAAPRPDPVAWALVAAQHRVTVWNSVPALAEILAETVQQRPELARPPVRVFLLSGDWIPVSLPGRLRQLWPGAAVTAMGGATEAAIWSNEYEVGEVPPQWRSIPYGTPLPNQTIRVLDHRLDLCPPWAEGGIYIGGAGLARGYYRDDVRTKEQFVPHPGTGERLYRTGDQGRYWPDGTIEFLGRADRQVKVQGFRVEPGEVEAVIRAHPAVRDCLVCAQRLAAGTRLVALVVADEVTGEELARHLRSRVPHYLVPGRIQLVPELPLTPNGKVDTERALAIAPARLAGAEGTAQVAGAEGTARPAGASLTGRLTEVWAELLGSPEVTPDDDFFALGGTSLAALRLINRLRAEFGVDLPFGQIFETPTIRALAGRIARGGPASSVVELAGGPGPALVLFHPVGGSVACYRDLARLWPGPVRACQSLGLVRGDAGPAEDLRVMAARYLTELAPVMSAAGQPVVLAGWSMGGILAYEAACQLRELGGGCRVVMIDSEVPGPQAGPDGDPASLHAAFLGDLAAGHLPAAAVRSLRRAAAAGLDLAEHAAGLAVGCGLLPPGTTVTAYRRLAAVHAGNAAALAGYRPGPSRVPGLLFVAAAPPRPDPAPAWRALAPSLQVQRIAGNHYSVMTGTSLDSIVSHARGWLLTR